MNDSTIIVATVRLIYLKQIVLQVLNHHTYHRHRHRHRHHHNNNHQIKTEQMLILVVRMQ